MPSEIRVNTIKSRAGLGTFDISDQGWSVTGIITATSFSGDGSGLTGIDATALKDSGGSVVVQANTSGAVVTGILTATSFSGNGGSLTGIQLTLNSQTSSYALVAGDVGKLIRITTGGVTVDQNIFSAGQSIVIYNNSASSQTITQGTGVTLRLAGTADTGNRTLQLRGLASILCVASNEFVVTGTGIL